MAFRYETDDLMVLRSIAKTPEGRRFIELLKTRLQAHDQELRSASGPAVGWIQGRAQELVDLVEALDTADQKLQAATPPQRPAVWQGARA